MSTHKMNIYVASSWRNPFQQDVVLFLRLLGHEVYDFRDPPGALGFQWEQLGVSKPETPDEIIMALRHPVAVKGFLADFNAMKACNALLLVAPCGSSSHLELGWAIGARKRTAVYFDDNISSPLEPELMISAADYLLRGERQLEEWAGRV